ncbi:hypothetical protein BUALT_Bualt16G0097800 [Buddleja alternifolia]|uniref:NADH dehydrogenase subunit 6 n=1 Tax=Buddleja alternifolia TaxID=168488 RepID=A0AAV6WGZ3_9LAMI|nr:hypothetical protein BUALT_Bualt16G0097800 [Buddleja alternifolia]
MREDVALVLVLQIAYFLALSVISFFSALVTILVLSMSYSAKTISLKDLFSRIGKTWTGPMITTFYVSGLAIGYSVFVVMLAAPLLMYPNSATYWVAILLGIVASGVYLYLFVAWGVAIVVSVVEESCYGLEALGKACCLLRGRVNKGFVNPTLYGLFLVNVSFLVKIFIVVAYTVLYFKCKKHHGEEIEL